MDRPDNLPELVEQIKERSGVPLLTDEQAGIFESGYVDSLDEALEVLEETGNYGKEKNIFEF